MYSKAMGWAFCSPGKWVCQKNLSVRGSGYATGFWCSMGPELPSLPLFFLKKITYMEIPAASSDLE